MDASNDGSRDLLRGIARRAMQARGLEPDFSVEAQQQTQALQHAPAMTADNARDQRALLWCSIDNDDSRDLDQLSVAEPLSGGAVRILVAIADVDAWVKRDSPIDLHAQANTTSVYTIAQIFPMLPEPLSTDLSSLTEGQDRLAIVIQMTIGPDGTLSDPDIYRARVRNKAKLAYDGVAAWLTGTAAAPARVSAVPGMDQQLRVQDQVAQRLRQVRHSHGALELESIEARPVFDGDLLRDLRPDESNRAKQLIEDFMIAANGVTARFLATRGLPSLRRVLRTPEKWDRIMMLARAQADTLPTAPSAQALNEFLLRRRAADPAGFPDLSLSVIKLLGRGEYSLEMPGQSIQGHFGLAVRDYTHSTAPNRRFPDVIAQRLLKAALAGAPTPYSPEQLRSLAAHCTAQEDNASKVERLVRKSAAAWLLASRGGHRFDGIITGAADKGTWVRIDSPTAEGRVVRGFENLQVGQRVGVRLVHTDVQRGFIDFERAD
ncbi:MAG TPA: RNB domain-containing ribonuclease [Steroidobacteraceae bacterium]|jgi:VacB/RNase II family 3'-5' exoribonuclease|nr:RNB domain-containing ribonuclease [Steroidobacteraceae bacterium]